MKVKHWPPAQPSCKLDSDCKSTDLHWVVSARDAAKLKSRTGCKKCLAEKKIYHTVKMPWPPPNNG